MKKITGVYQYRGYQFRYNASTAEVEAWDPEVGVYDSVGLSNEHWNDLEARDQYLDQYIDDLEAEGSALADDFIKYELPALQKAGSV